MAYKSIPSAAKTKSEQLKILINQIIFNLEKFMWIYTKIEIYTKIGTVSFSYEDFPVHPNNT